MIKKAAWFSVTEEKNNEGEEPYFKLHVLHSCCADSHAYPLVQYITDLDQIIQCDLFSVEKHRYGKESS